jgi:hypothetical protein
MDDLIKQGAEALRAGKRDEARKLLLTAVKQNPDSESAWGWLYNVAGNDKERIYCLKQVLRINPNNEKVNQLYKSLLDKQSQPENNQPQVSKQINQQVSTVSQPIQKRPAKKNKSTNTKSNRVPLIIIGVLASISLCVCGFFALGLLFNSSNRTTAKVLSAQDVFEVSAIDVVKDEGYTVTSAVCEVISSERFLPSVNVDGGQIVFHAFRITKPTLSSEVTVLFYSNHTAAQGRGLVFTVNSDASRLFPDFPDASRNSDYPITVDTAGARDALECAQQAGSSPPLDLGNFDTDEWRRRAIEKFGPEETYSDGSKDDYVRLALSICNQTNAERETMLTNLGADYEGSFQQFVIETFCPYVK